MLAEATARLVTSDGTTFEGRSIGAIGAVSGELVFTTGMTGYEEVLTDPAFHGQIVTLTAPEIGNTGVNGDDAESSAPRLAGLVLHAASSIVSHHRAKSSLEAYLREHAVVAVAGLDTRAITRYLREHGSARAALGTEPVAQLRERAEAHRPSADPLASVSTPRAYDLEEGEGVAASGPRVVVVDLGVKRGILRALTRRGCRVTVVPFDTPPDDVLARDPSGVVLSSGPGDPAQATKALATVRALIGRAPLLGIGLGHQLLALAIGGRTTKMKLGHRGANHPVRALRTGAIEITYQNHGYVVDRATVEGRAEITHLHLEDGSLMGLELASARALSVQYQPESSAGAAAPGNAFGRFLALLA